MTQPLPPAAVDSPLSLDSARRASVLVVDDEQENLELVARILAEDFEVITAKSAHEALDQLRQPGIAVILSDYRMPGLSGVDFFAQVERRQYPATRIMLTGWADLEGLVAAINRARVFRYLTKPVAAEDLRAAVCEAVEHYSLTQTNLRLTGLTKMLMEDNSQIARRLMELGGDLPNSPSNPLEVHQPRKVHLAILFMDLRGFSILCRKMAPEKVFDVLQLIYRTVHKLIHASGGMVDKHMGDGLMALFGFDGSPGLAAGRECMRRLVDAYAELAPEIERLTGVELKLGLGLAAGEVVVGVLGTEMRNELAIIGGPVNLASRLQEFTKYLFPRISELRGKHCTAIGVCLPELADGISDFIQFGLPVGVSVRDLSEIRMVSIVCD